MIGLGDRDDLQNCVPDKDYMGTVSRDIHI